MADIQLPTPGVTPSPQWAPLLNEAISKVNGEIEAVSEVVESGRLSEAELNTANVTAIDEHTGQRLTETHILIGAGQSNMAGMVSLSGIPNEVSPHDDRIFTYAGRGTYANQLVKAVDPIRSMDTTQNGIGPLMMMGREYARRHPGVRVILINAAKGGVGFGSADPDWSWSVTSTATTNLAHNLVNLATAAKDEAEDAWPDAPVSCAGIVWLHGETDGGNSMAKGTYSNYLDELIDYVRDELDWAATAPWAIGQMLGEAVLTSNGRYPIQRALFETPSRKPYTAVVAQPPVDGRYVQGDNLHANYAGIRWYAGEGIDALERALPRTTSGMTLAEAGRPRHVDTILPAWKGAQYYRAPMAETETNNALGNGTLRLVPFYLPNGRSLGEVAVEVTVAGESGSKYIVAIYEDSGQGKPWGLVTSATVATDSTGVKTASIGVTLRAGWYWIGGAVVDAPTTQPTMRTVKAASLMLNIEQGSSAPSSLQTPNRLFSQTGVTSGGGVPAVFGGAGAATPPAAVMVKTA